MYYWIEVSEDGDLYNKVYSTVQELQEAINERYDGIDPKHYPVFKDTLPDMYNSHICIIKGEAKVPEPVETVVRMEIK